MSGADDSNSMAAIAAMTTVGIPRLDLESPSLGGSPRPAIGGDSAPSSASGGSSSAFSSPFSAAAEDLGTGQHLAVKVCRIQADAEKQRRAEREVRAHWYAPAIVYRLTFAVARGARSVSLSGRSRSS